MIVSRRHRELINIIIIINLLIEFGLQAKPSNLYREFVLLAAPRDDHDDDDDSKKNRILLFVTSVLRLIL